MAAVFPIPQAAEENYSAWRQALFDAFRRLEPAGMALPEMPGAQRPQTFPEMMAGMLTEPTLKEAVASGVMGLAGPMPMLTKQGQQWANKSKQLFGITDNLKEAGYILPKGELLDFSGKNMGGWGGSRVIDHRDIWQAMSGQGGGTEGMFKFMQNADAIRTHFDGDTLYLSLFNKTKPTDYQLRAITNRNRWINDIAIDIMDQNGNTIISKDIYGRNKGAELKRLIDEVFK